MAWGAKVDAHNVAFKNQEQNGVEEAHDVHVRAELEIPRLYARNPRQRTSQRQDSATTK